MVHQLTRSDIEKMEAEIARRKGEIRSDLLAKLKEARAHGDLSENFEYHAAKKEKAKNDSRIRYLERMIRNSDLIEEESKADVAGIGKTVTFYIEEDDETESCSIVSTMLANSLENRVSIESPIGEALSGHHVGDRVFVPVGKTAGYYVKITGIENYDDSDVPINAY